MRFLSREQVLAKHYKFEKSSIKMILKRLGVNVLCKDMKSVKAVAFEDVGHPWGWMRVHYHIIMKNGDVIKMVSDPSGGGDREWNLEE